MPWIKRTSIPQFHPLGWVLSLWLCGFNWATAATPQHLEISEFCAANTDSLTDESGEFADWIELHNPTGRPYDLSDYCLTDDPRQPKKFRLPSALLLPGERALLFASGKTNKRSEPPFHLPFKLSSDGEYLGLVDYTSGTIVHEFAPNFPPQVPGLSYGLVKTPEPESLPANERAFDILKEPTPGKPNSVRHPAPRTVTLQTPEFSVPRGFFKIPFQLRLSSPSPETTVIYTTDGSAPTSDHGTEYREEIPINNSQVVRAIAVNGDESSPVQTHSYLFLGQVAQQTRPPSLPELWDKVPGDYDMDRRITEHEDYSAQLVPSLQSLPTLSLAIQPDHLFHRTNGIYSHPEEQGVQWERPASFEWIEGERRTHQANAGLRIQGAWFRGPEVTRKHSFRLLFKHRYGEPTLNFDVFEEFGASKRFNSLVLRAGGNDGYSWDQANGAEQYIRDEFGRRLSLAFGQPAPRGRFVHLYLNGLYWGIYNLCERPDEAFSASYVGGSTGQWDAINSGTAKNGDLDAWTRVIHAMSRIKSVESYLAVQGLDGNGKPDARLTRFLNTEHYIDYLLANIWVGNADWPDKNYWLGWYRGTPSDGFRLYSWDLEVSLGNSRARSPLDYQAPQRDSIRSGSTEPHFWLRSIPEYQINFADRVHRYLSHSGPLSIAAMRRQYNRWADEIESALVAESARWGDDQFPTPRTVAEWQREKEWVLNHYLLHRGDIVLEQLQNSGLYPRLAAPQIMPEPEGLAPESPIWLSGTVNEIYYTLDGTDPRLPGGDVNPAAEKLNPTTSVNLPSEYFLIGEKSVWRYASAGIPEQPDWESIDNSTEVTWKAGLAPLGLGSKLIKTTVARTIPSGTEPSAVPLIFRKPFTLSTPRPIDRLEMVISCSDAVTVLINNSIVYRTDPLPPRPYSTLDRENTEPQAIEIPALGIVSTGRNEIKVFVHQRNALDTTTHFDLSLKAYTPVNANQLFMAPLTQTNPVRLMARAFDGRKWSPLLDTDLVRASPLSVPGSVYISELNFRPRTQLSADEGAITRDPADFQFIRISNPTNESIDLSGARLERGIEFEFPRRTILPPNESGIVVRNLRSYEARYSLSDPILGEFQGRLSDRGERVSLRAKDQSVIDSIRYRTDSTWPIGPKTEGVSLVRRFASDNNPDHPDSWEQHSLRSPSTAPETDGD